MKKIILFLTFALGVILLPNFSKADTLAEQSILTTSSTQDCSSNSPVGQYWCGQSLGNGLQGYLLSVDMGGVFANVGSGNMSWLLCGSASSTFNLNNNCSWSGNSAWTEIYRSGLQSETDGTSTLPVSQYYAGSWLSTSSISLDPNLYYFLYLYGNNGIDGFYPYGSTNPNAYANGTYANSLGNIKDVYFSLNGTSTQNYISSYPQMQILYPVNSSSTFIHDFNYFTFVATNPNSSDNVYRFAITYDTTSTFQNTPLTISRGIIYGFAPNATHYLNIPKTNYLATSTTYYAKLCAVANLDTAVSCTDTITFKTGDYPYSFQINSEQAGFFNTTTTEAGLLMPATSTSISTGLICSNVFYSPVDWICQATNGVIAGFNIVKDFMTGIFQSGVESVQKVFPLNVLVKFNQDLAQVQATTTDTEIILTGQGTAFKKAGGGYYSFNFLSSSTLTTASISKTGFDWESLVVYFLWAITGIFIIGTAFVILHKSSNNSPK